jgi:acyl CoA:acetate/3-ketoacid CoA transferase alpha subunit
MDVIEQGEGALVGWHDPDEARRWVQQNKRRDLVDKRMPVSEAVKKYAADGSFLAMGGFGHIRVSMEAVYEMIRQRKRKITIAGKTAVHDCDILIGAGVVDKIEVAYSFGHELRGLSPASRRAVETGKCKVLGEISNAGYQWRFLAASMGVPFIPSRTMLGTDTLRKSSAKVVKDPWSGKPVCLLPACYPDVTFIHVPRCDIYGNAQIDGIMIEDFELARAARRLVITTEKIIDTEEIRAKPWHTAIPHFLVDAVVESKYGSHPCQMPLQYFFDEEHIGEWLSVSKTDEGAQKYFDKYVHGTEDFAQYLQLVGGTKQMEYLRDVEMMKQPMKAPWLKEG